MIIVKPLVTEKSMTDVRKGIYSFVVAKDARKAAIKSSIKAQFNVTVSSIATSIVKGKTQRVGVRRQEAAKPEWKKATVTVKKGEKIALFEPGGEEKKK
ncbi:MAG TPA: 50S ribosomal protein L23 [Candidatus Sulfotelmatobacter sp.]|jgi:large subunit ribosomal protein L23|nr:50S ribosomal protein L23 [Candidatus Sulfotelmatobacter sp.]